MINEPQGTPITNTPSEATPMFMLLPTLGEKIQRISDAHLDSLAKTVDEMNEELDRYRAFVKRLIAQYKAKLTNYTVRCQLNIDQANARKGVEQANDRMLNHWRAELNEATRQLALSDTELMPIIEARSPEHLVTRVENAMLDAAPDGPNGPVVESQGLSDGNYSDPSKKTGSLYGK